MEADPIAAMSHTRIKETGFAPAGGPGLASTSEFSGHHAALRIPKPCASRCTKNFKCGELARHINQELL
jgi:hypothetical protein